jgi:hypothetical protein
MDLEWRAQQEMVKRGDLAALGPQEVAELLRKNYLRYVTYVPQAYWSNPIVAVVPPPAKN